MEQTFVDDTFVEYTTLMDDCDKYNGDKDTRSIDLAITSRNKLHLENIDPVLSHRSFQIIQNKSDFDIRHDATKKSKARKIKQWRRQAQHIQNFGRILDDKNDLHQLYQQMANIMEDKLNNEDIVKFFQCFSLSARKTMLQSNT